MLVHANVHMRSYENQLQPDPFSFPSSLLNQTTPKFRNWWPVSVRLFLGFVQKDMFYILLTDVPASLGGISTMKKMHVDQKRCVCFWRSDSIFG